MIGIVKKKIAFFASSPFQIISAVNIASFFHENSFKVLFTFDKSLKSSFFDKIYLMERENKGFTFVYFLKTLFFPQKAIKDQIKNYDKSLYFEEIYCTDCNSLMCSIYLVNKKAKLHLIEDGARNFCIQKDHYRILRKIMKFFFKKLYSDNFYDTIVFEPKMLSTNMKVLKEPFFLKNELAKSVVYDFYKKRMFKNDINSEDIIYFDQPFGFKDMELKILEVIKKNVTRNKIKFKMHPKNKENIKNSFKTEVFEPYFVKNPELLDNLTLISVSSTVLFSSKIIFDKEPRVIFLYKIFEIIFKASDDEFLCYKNKTFHKAVKKLKNLYKDKSKILIPKNISDLEDILRRQAW